jgi:hypothetical protein
MKKILLFVLIVLFCVFIFPFKVKRVCFGDVCPQNGGVYVMYRLNYSKDECLQKGAYPVEGIGWTTVYAGCSPINGQILK